jgi:galactokinase
VSSVKRICKRDNLLTAVKIMEKDRAKKIETGNFFGKLHGIFFEKFIRGNREKENVFKKENLINILSPGRVNIIGEHTDYNLGFSIPIAVDKYIALTGKANDSDTVKVYSEYFDSFYKFPLSDVAFDENVKWANYLKGVLQEYIQGGYEIGGFSMVIGGNLPMGVGMSSSAALEVGVAKFLEELFNLKISREETVKYCNSAENNFVGVSCGFLDQFAVTYGKENSAIFLNFRDLSYERIPFDLKDSVILIVDSKEERNLSSTEYNKRRVECREAVEMISSLAETKNIYSLSDISLDLLYKLKEKLPAKLFKRARHVVTENSRVLLSKEYLMKGDIEKLGLVLLESHNSLKCDYCVSTKKLDFLVNEISKVKGVYGARLMGAGFGGSIISIVRRDRVSSIIDVVGNKFFKEFAVVPDFIECLPSDGAKRVEKNNKECRKEKGFKKRTTVKKDGRYLIYYDF